MKIKLDHTWMYKYEKIFVTGDSSFKENLKGNLV